MAGKEELTSFHHLFWTKTQKNLTDGHIWFSIFHRPPRSRFTRVQRLTCCLALLFTSMMANILFYQSGDDSEDSGVKVDHINYTFTRLYSRVCCSIALQCDACINLLCVYARFQTFSIGPINFTLQMIYVGVISALLVFPASIGIVALFRL